MCSSHSLWELQTVENGSRNDAHGERVCELMYVRLKLFSVFSCE